MYSKMYKKCEKTYKILRSEITFLMDLYSNKTIMAIINEFSRFNGVSMTNQCIFNGMCVQYLMTSILGPS